MRNCPWVGDKPINRVKVVDSLSKGGLCGEGQRYQSRNLGDRHRKGLGGTWLLSASGSRVNIGGVGVHPGVVWGPIFPSVWASWMTSCLWGTPAPVRPRVCSPSQCLHPPPAPCTPSPRSSRTSCRRPPPHLRWTSSGLRSECWVCVGIGGSWEE